MEYIEIVQTVLAALGTLLFLHKIVYALIALFTKPKSAPPTDKKGHYAVLIAARNEEDVIGQLICSLHKQTYPTELLDIFVVADNCTDNTATAAANGTRKVYERFNTKRVGKGFALEELLQRMKDDGFTDYDAYFIFDADNLLDINYIEEMNREFQKGGYDAVTSYRNSKNFGDNWISAGNAISFLREARLINYPRQFFKTSSAVSGTGYMISAEAMKKTNGWRFFTLTEDLEFTAYTVANGGKIGYCDSARFYDEQPTDFKQSWNQRLRWAKGYLQVIGKHGLDLIATLFKKGSFACWDMICAFLPAFVVVTVNLLFWIIEFIAKLSAHESLLPMVFSAISGIAMAYGILYLIGLLTTLLDWKQLRTTNTKKILYTFTFPVFMFIYVPISAMAMFTRVEWKPIKHKAASSVDEYLK